MPAHSRPVREVGGLMGDVSLMKRTAVCPRARDGSGKPTVERSGTRTCSGQPDPHRGMRPNY
ncbi:MAG: hypothetical protein WCQ95_04960 [Bacteroidota bacterium]